MNKKIEPLLKEEEETFPFLEEPKKETFKKDQKDNKALITTIILSVIILFVTYLCFYPFYVGFKYYDVRFASNQPVEVEEKKNEDIPLNSAILNNTYNKYNVTNNNELSDLFDLIYSGNTNVSQIDTSHRLAMIFTDAGLTCQSLTITKTQDELRKSALKLFNDDSLLNNINNVLNNFSVSYDEASKAYTITRTACPTTNDYVMKKITKATEQDDKLYVYEKVGYFVATEPYAYDVYANAKKETLITQFNDVNKDHSFTNYDILATYKWTYKKGNDNNYYLESITRA